MGWNRKTDRRQFEPIATTAVVGHDGKVVARQDHFVVCRPQSLLVRLAPGLFENVRHYLELLDQLAEAEREGKVGVEGYFQEERDRIRKTVKAIDKALAFDERDEPGGHEVREQIASLIEKRAAEVREMAEAETCIEARAGLFSEAAGLRAAAEAARTGRWPEVG